MTRKEEILQGLNNAQKTVVQSINGKYCVLATAGAGKVDTLRWTNILRKSFAVQG